MSNPLPNQSSQSPGDPGITKGLPLTEAQLTEGRENFLKMVAKRKAEKEAETANARQVGGDHYKTGGEEHWDRVHRLGLDYFQGQITKYIERWKKKNGVQDLMKARHFLDKYIELMLATNLDTPKQLTKES